MRDGIILGARDRDEILLRVAGCLLDGECGVSGLAESDAHTTLLVADNDRNREIETATAGHHARHAAGVDSHLVELTALAGSTAARGAAAVR